MMLTRRILSNGKLGQFGSMGRSISQKLEQVNKISSNEQASHQKTLRLIPEKEFVEFQNYFPQIVHQLTHLDELKTEKMLDEVNERIRTFLEYNVCLERLWRPQMVLAASNFFSKGKSTKSGHQLYNLGWLTELVHTSQLLIDDVVDMEDTREGQICWYRRDDTGLEAMNDGVLLGSLALKFLDLNFADDPTYPKLTAVCDVVQTGVLAGKSIFLTPGLRQTTKLNLEGYKNAMKLMHGYDAFYGPFALAMIWNGVDEPRLMELMKNVTLDLGLLSAIKGHYTNSLGDEKFGGKMGSDIPNGRATWPFLVALGKANEGQRLELLENYGRHDQRNVDQVKQLYVDIGVPQLYQNVVDESRQNLTAAIEALPATLPQETLQTIVDHLVE